MVRRGNKLIARVDVPKELVKIIGKTSLKQSLRTGDVGEAKVRHHQVMAAFTQTIENARKKLRGEPIPNPAESIIGTIINIDLPPWAVMPGDGKPKVSLQRVYDEWVLAKQPQPNTAAEYKTYMDQFIAQNGDHPVRQYTKDHARKWRDYVMAMDRAQSTKEKVFGAIRTLFRYADRNDYLSEDPFAKVILETPNRPKESRREEWSTEQLQVWFKCPIYTDRQRPKAAGGEAAYWLPVLALYHGFRAGELCQLDKADLIRKDGIPCLRIRPSDDDSDGHEKSVKTSESWRVVPLHKRVIELGFLAYVDTLNGKKLFPKIEPDTRGRWSGHYSKWFGRYRRAIGLDQRWTDFHSFRHTWKTAARGISMPEDHHDEISGHDNASVGRSYGRIPVKNLKTWLDRIKFDVTIPKWRGA
jgi:integrase